MKLTTFMTVFNTKKTNEDKLEFIQSHIKNEYVPYEEKADRAKAIVNASYWHNEDGRKVFRMDSVASYMLKCMTLIDLYTDIERPKKEGTMLETFNTLNSTGVLDMVIQNMDKRELKELNMVIEMTEKDAWQNYAEPHAFFAGQIERFGALISMTLGPIIEKLDLDKIKEIAGEIQG